MEELNTMQSVEPKPKGLSFLWILITIILTIAVVGGGGYWYMNKKATSDKAKLQTQIDDLNKQITDLKAASSTSSTTTTPATTDETANWKTYTNADLNYSVKYPADWVIAVESKNLSINSPENQALKDKIDNKSMYGEGYAPTILVQYFESADAYVNMGNPQVHVTKSVSEFFQDSALNNSFKEITLGGKKAYERESGGFSGIYYDIVCEYKSKVYDLQIVSEKKNLTTIEKTIINSLQFIK